MKVRVTVLSALVLMTWTGCAQYVVSADDHAFVVKKRYKHTYLPAMTEHGRKTNIRAGKIKRVVATNSEPPHVHIAEVNHLKERYQWAGLGSSLLGTAMLVTGSIRVDENDDDTMGGVGLTLGSMALITGIALLATGLSAESLERRSPDAIFRKDTKRQ